MYVFVMAGITGCNPSEKGKTDQEKIKEMVSALSLEQKAQLLIGTGMFMDLPDSIKNMFGDRKMDENTDTLYTNMVDRIRKYLPGAAGFSSEFPEIGISSQVLADGPAGLRIQPKRKGEERTYYCTAFPIATVLASSWDTELVYRVGEAMGNDVLEYGADVLLAPGMNIQRDPLCGRNFEYYSEDPLVTGKMAAAMVKGIQSNGVGTSVKHFAANNQETNRMSVNTVVSERALREIYLKGFEIAVKEAQPWTVMSSYNKINGVYTSESHDLLTKILRDDWGFAGYVMTDWGGGSDVVEQMEAGNDMIQPGQPKQIQELIAAVNEGRLDEAVLDQNLSRILGIMLKTPKYQGYAYSSNPDLQAHANVTRQAATDGMVLLENKSQALPIAENLKKVAAFGNTSYDFVAGGTGSGDVNEAYTISLIEGLKSGGFETDGELAAIYEAYIKETRAKAGAPKNWLAALMGGKEPVEEMPLAKALAAKMAGKADVALITIGRNSGEGGDREAVEGDFYLTATEKALIKDVSEAFRAKGKKAIVVLNVGGVIETASWREWPDAVLMAWQPGQEAGNSVVDVLTGRVNPSGKLAITFPISYQDVPSAKNFPGVEVKSDQTDDAADLSGFSFMRRVPWEVVYEEDIYVGYRYYNTFGVPVAYEFGYGLSYTNFEYANLQLGSTTFDGMLTASVEVKNTGSFAGREVVQVYASAPNGKLEKPEATLVAFGKTHLLQPGETETLSFTIAASDLASFDEAASAWIVEPGSYALKVGASSLKIHQTASFEVDSEMNVGQVSKALAPQRNFDRLSFNK
ncbi:MAG: glycoside hydrolase family 3 N-terminal domain-containing protein [Mangrovibacterium sp.]